MRTALHEAVAADLMRCQTFFDQIALNFPVFERRQQQPVRLITMKSIIWCSCLLSIIFIGFLQFASRFCPSPFSAFRPCSPRDHCFRPLSLPV